MREGTDFHGVCLKVDKMKTAELVASPLRVMGEVAVTQVSTDASATKLS
jgi:hypothetical protein